MQENNKHKLHRLLNICQVFLIVAAPFSFAFLSSLSFFFGFLLVRFLKLWQVAGTPLFCYIYRFHNQIYTLEDKKWSCLSGLTYHHCNVALITLTKITNILIWVSKYFEIHFHISFFIVSYRKMYYLARGICFPWPSALGSICRHSALGSSASQILLLQFQVIGC